MKIPPGLIGESDYFRLAALDYSNLTPIDIKVENGRVWFYYRKRDAEPVLSAYDSGQLRASLRDFSASLVRIKTKIFSIERERTRQCRFEISKVI